MSYELAGGLFPLARMTRYKERLFAQGGGMGYTWHLWTDLLFKISRMPIWGLPCGQWETVGGRGRAKSCRLPALPGPCGPQHSPRGLSPPEIDGCACRKLLKESSRVKTPREEREARPHKEEPLQGLTLEARKLRVELPRLSCAQ